MSSSDGKTVSFRWEIKNFYSWWNNNANKDMFSDSFKLASASFALFYKPIDIWTKEKFGVIFKGLVGKQLLEVKLKLWFENEQAQKFQENTIESYVFNKVEENCEFNLNTSGNDRTLFCNVYNGHKNLYICCEITDLHGQATVPITDVTQQCLQNIWKIYEEGMHDAIIKINETEFKILKAFFMAQSDVFKQMFNSNFKEGQTSVVNIKDVSEQTMAQLVKWMYTYQIDDKSVVEDLFEIAGKYDVKLLKVNCAELMINDLDNSNVLRRLILAAAHNEQQLKDATLNFFRKMSATDLGICLVSPEWIKFVQKKPANAEEVSQLITEKLKNCS